MKPYPDYKDSDLPWLGSIPKHWKTYRLKYTANVSLSNVDKHSIDGEAEVRLCNYTDVYYNTRITNAIEFMAATAPQNQVEKFRLHIGDVLMTKDSETPADIGVPAVVDEELEGVLCGYHLAMLRPHKQVSGAYLRYVLASPPFRDHFRMSANGVTRVGLSNNDITTALTLLPPVAEQAAIITFLDRKTADIERFITEKRQLIALLNEQKAALINRAVTQGLNPDAPRKASGTMFVDKVPEHWEVKRGKYYFDEVDERSETGAEELLSVSHITGVTLRSEKNITMFVAESYEGSKTCQPGDIVINTMWAWMGALGISSHSGIVSSSYGIYRQHDPNTFLLDYLDHLLKAKAYVGEYNCRSTGIHDSRLRMYPDDFLDIRIIRPPIEEQKEILTWIRTETRKIDQIVVRTEREIDLINEYRTTLISDAVTGKMDVREALDTDL